MQQPNQTDLARKALPVVQDRRAAKMRRALELAGDGERLISMRTVIAMTSWSRASIYRLVEEGKFPKPRRLGANRIAFRESEIQAYVASRELRDRDEGSDNGAPAHA